MGSLEPGVRGSRYGHRHQEVRTLLLSPFCCLPGDSYYRGIYFTLDALPSQAFDSQLSHMTFKMCVEAMGTQREGRGCCASLSRHYSPQSEMPLWQVVLAQACYYAFRCSPPHNSHLLDHCYMSLFISYQDTVNLC